MFLGDNDKIVKDQLGVNLRGDKHVSFLQSLGEGFKYVRGLLNTHRTEVKHLLRFNSSKVYMEHFLNNELDLINREIYLQRTERIKRWFVFHRDEERPVYLYGRNEANAEKRYLFGRNEITNSPSFKVYVPNTIQLTDEKTKEIRNKIDLFNMAGFAYEIVQI